MRGVPTEPGSLVIESQAMPENPFTPLEYDPLKLLRRPEKVAAIFAVRDGVQPVDASYPISVEVHLTDLCNLSCPWCTDQVLRENKAQLPVEVLDRLFADLAPHGVGVTLEGGGEPTVHPAFGEVVASARRHGLELGLITNGVRPLTEHAGAFQWVRVSVDAATAEEYLVEKGADCFEKVMQNLAALAQGPREYLLGAGYVITNRNADQLPAFVERLNTLGVDYAYLRPVEEALDLLPDLDTLYELKASWQASASERRLRVLLNIDDRLRADNEGHPCVAHSLTCIIHANGDVSMCEKRRHDPVVFGNLEDASFGEIWASDLRRETSQRLRDPANQVGCQACRITRFNRTFVGLTGVRTKNFI